MTEEERVKIKDHIRNELSALEKSIQTLTGLLINEEVQSDANDWFTTKESNPSKEINELALAKAKQKMVMLRNALQRVDSPLYGICAKCGNPIPYERLSVISTATRCLACG